MATHPWLCVGLLELQYCNYVRYQKIDFVIQSRVLKISKGNKIHLMIIGDPLTSLFTPSRGKHQSGLDPSHCRCGEKIFSLNIFCPTNIFCSI